MTAATVLVAVAGAGAVAAQDADALRQHAAAWERLAAAEDARAATAAQLQVLLDGLRSRDPVLRLVAVRGVGRLERSDLAKHIAPLLGDSAAQVRAAAAHAIGQSVSRGAGGDMSMVRTALHAALATERDPAVRAALVETVGRLPHGDAEATAATVALLVPRLQHEPTTVLGALRGLYLLARQQPAWPAVKAAAAALRPLAARAPMGADELTAARIRRLAVMTLVVAGAHDAAVLEGAFADADPLVRREAGVGLNTLSDSAAVRALVVERALRDSAAGVRYEGVRAYGRHIAARDGCAPLRRAARDGNAHVALLAIDLLRTTCPGDNAVTAQLDSFASALASGNQWHHAAHALVSLSARSPARARTLLPRFAAHPNLFVRTYAAMAAAGAGDTTALLRFARDAHANVRTAAVEGLSRLLGGHADTVYLAQLALDDSQLLQAAAAALDSTTLATAAPAMLDALDRITAQRRETSRDARVALLQTVRSVGSAAFAARVRPYLTDFDPEVAALAAKVLEAWTGTRPTPEATAPPRIPLPLYAEAAQLATTNFTVQLEDADSFVIRLLPFAAPTNAARFARLARAGYFDGLTFHRIAPNFVVQGGSPGANEYAGDGPYTRDEVGVPNWRGTVGLSTRGRDTGDGQIFINLVDNVRLDHNYTVFGVVVHGMDVVDRLLEGALIRRITEHGGAR
jgi:cyclophilin family peptidyl-prolyl cis-trans isomerase/HEAT repeat protein